MTTIPRDVLDLPVGGRNLAPGTLRDQLGSTPTLVAFVRHLG